MRLNDIKTILKSLMVPCLIIFLTTFSCNEKKESEIKIYCAGSLAHTIEEIAESFEEENPDIKIKIEAYGSVEAVRKITDLNKIPDIIAVSDYKLIDEYLIPKYTKENNYLVSNKMVICYNEKSRKKEIINSNNWFEVLKDEEIKLGRSDPDADPCGYRSLFVFELAEHYYKKDGLFNELKNKTGTIIRPKEVDLLALLETGNIDYLIIYKSVAVQHNLKFIELPDEINLSNPEFNNLYSKTCYTLKSSSTENNVICGQAILYSFAVINNSLEKSEVEKFVKFLTDREKGGRMFTKNGFVILN